MRNRPSTWSLATACVVALAGVPAALLAQAPAAPAPAFEVASVKPNTSGDNRIRIQNQPGGRFVATNAPVLELIRVAYQVQNFQIVGAPSWVASERFDVTAKAEGDVPPAVGAPGGAPGPLQLMLRALLAERFKLTVREDTRELDIYALVMARADGRRGDKLIPSAVDCGALAAARGRGGAPAPAPLAPGERPMCGIRIGPGTLAAGGASMAQFAAALSPMVQRVVTDQTRLTGNFDIDLQWTPDQLPQGPPPPGAPPLPPIDPNGPSIFTAVQEQLGLELNARKGPVSVLVIDRVEPPTPD